MTNGVFDSNNAATPAVRATGTNGAGGVLATSDSGTAVSGTQTSNQGNNSLAGVIGTSNALDGNGVIGEANGGPQAYGVWGKSTSGYAGFFEGNVQVDGNVQVNGNLAAPGLLANGTPGVKGIGGGDTNGDNVDGVQGFGSGTFSGVAGFGGGNSGTGVFGLGGGTGGPGVRGIGAGGPNTFPSAAGPVGVYGQAGPNGDGVQGVGSVGVRGVSGGAAGDTGVAAESNSSGELALVALGSGGGAAGFFGGPVTIIGDLFVVGGTKSAVVPFPDGSHRQLYCLESPENWFEDFGFGHLTGGQAQVQLDADFAATVNTDAYHVFIAEYDDNNALFVTNRTNTGFEVRAKTSTRDATFSYRVVAKRKDIAPARLGTVTLPTLEDIKARLARGRGA